jgi:hypothetical protein
VTTADAAYWMGFTRDLLAALAIVVGAVVSYWLLSRLSPRFKLKVEPKWEGDNLFLKIEVENTALVRSTRPAVQLQILRYAADDGRSLSEWVPFTEDKIIEGEEPLEWREPRPVFAETSERVYPGEVMAVERLDHFPDDVLLHVGLRVALGRSITWWRKHSQTTTRFVVKPPPEPVRPGELSD